MLSSIWAEFRLFLRFQYSVIFKYLIDIFRYKFTKKISPTSTFSWKFTQWAELYETTGKSKSKKISSYIFYVQQKLKLCAA